MLTNRQKAIEMGQNGFEKIKRDFDINLIADRHIMYYKSIITQKSQTKVEK
jgi:hypothetical protein